MAGRIFYKVVHISKTQSYQKKCLMFSAEQVSDVDVRILN